MIKWPKRKPDQRLAQRYREGQEFSAQVTGIIDQFMALHARKIGEGIYSVFNQLVSDIETDGDASPIDVAGGHVIIFIEELDKFRASMRDKCVEFLGEIWSAVETIGAQDMMMNYVDQKLLYLYTLLLERATDRGADLVTAYKLMGYTASERGRS